MSIDSDIPFLGQLMNLYRAGDLSAEESSTGTLMVAQLQRMYGAIFQNDFPGAMAYMTDDIELEILGPAENPLTGCWRGSEQVLQALQRNFGVFENQRPELIGVTAHEDAVLVMGRETGRVRATQQLYSVHWVQWFTFRELKLCRMLEIFDSQEVRPAYTPPA